MSSLVPQPRMSSGQVDLSTTVTFTSVSLIFLTTFIALTATRVFPIPNAISSYSSLATLLADSKPSYSERARQVENMLRKNFSVVHRSQEPQGLRFEVNLAQRHMFIQTSDRLSAQYLPALEQIYHTVRYAHADLDIYLLSSPHFRAQSHAQLLSVLRFFEDMGLESSRLRSRIGSREIEIENPEIHVSFLLRSNDEN